ncbi:hypothetical protein ACGFYQ_34235 [Streptomyces sp. NPDC048258]|uniref:DUF7210 family protein n=1 Tax=Streptomyces sp. NPDC048258 TaxID=3365527 RepID=UPI0037179AF9
MTTKNAPTTSTTPTPATEEKSTAPAAPVVGPPSATDAPAVTVVLSHHLRIGGADYPPGATIRVSPDYARRLRTQGYTART